MANRILESISSTINVDIGTPGFVSLDVDHVSANQVTGLAPSATIDTTNATNISSGSFNGVANNTNFVGSVSAANVVSNAQLQSNLNNYQTTAGLSANIAYYISSYTGSIEANAIIVGNSTVNLVANSSTLYVSNSTGNTQIGPASAQMGNSTVYNVVNAIASALIANTTANLIINSSSILLNTNSSINVFVTGSSLTFQTNSTSNVIANSTQIIINGNASYNSAINQVTYTFNSPGVSIVRPYVSVLVANHALVANSNTAVQNVFGAGQMTCTLAANTTYLIDATYMVANASFAANTQLQTAFANSVAIGSIYYGAIVSLANNNSTISSVTTTSVYVTSLSATTISAPSTNAVANLTATINIKGAIITGAATTITPQLAYTVACNSTPQILSGSYITYTPVGNIATCNSWGTWS